MKKSTYFIIISSIFLSFLVVFYGGRLLYFRSLSKRLEKVGEVTLTEIIKSKIYDSSIQTEGDNLHYKGQVLNNYVYYSNRYFRVLGMEDGQVLLVDDVQTMLPFGDNFQDSDIYTWLNNKYIKTLLNYEEKLDNTETCFDKECTNKVISKIGLLSSKQYEKANEKGNYLNSGKYYWLSDGSYIDKNGNIQEKDDGIYGVRGVIRLKKEVAYFGGTGTYYDPYFIDLEDAYAFAGAETQVDTIKIGSYILYSDKIWRVIDTTDTVKLLSQDSIGKLKYNSNHNLFDEKDKNSIAYYLNHTFLEGLDKTHLVEGVFHIGIFNTSFQDQYMETISTYVGLPEMGDLLLTDASNYFLLTNTGSKNTVYKVISGMLYADDYQNENEIYPVIHLNKNIKIKEGHGTKESPLIVGEL